MTRRLLLPLPAIAALAFILAPAGPVHAQAKAYPDGHGGEVMFPEGDASFADEVVHYDTGSDTPADWARDPAMALGTPDYDASRNRGYASLGCGGELILKFVDNALINIPGPDLYVFEVGPAIEPTALAISADGETWTRVGRIEGGKAEIDIAPYVDPDETFRYVRLVDLKARCGGATPGADIDAVGAIGSARRIALSGEVLFDTGKYELKSSAEAAVQEALAGTDPAHVERVTVAGHTDSVGSAEANHILSESRARAVAAHLQAALGFPVDKLETAGHGATQPVASNDSAAGRQQNRRVEITVHTAAPAADAEAATKTKILGLWRSGAKRLIELREVGGVVLGEYSYTPGRIRGSFTDETTFTGHWMKDDAARACDSERDGTRHWGTLRLDFDSPAHDSFEARWANCDEEKWSGTWPRAERVL